MTARQGADTPGMYWSAAEAARQCGTSRATIDRALKAGRLAADKDGEGAWRITPHALIEAGFKPGTPSPPDTESVASTAPGPGEADDELARLRAEVAELRGEVRGLTAERDAARELHTAAAAGRDRAWRELDEWRRMLPPGPSAEQSPAETATQASSATAEPSTDTPGHSHQGDPVRPATGRIRQAWNRIRY